MSLLYFRLLVIIALLLGCVFSLASNMVEASLEVNICFVELLVFFVVLFLVLGGLKLVVLLPVLLELLLGFRLALLVLFFQLIDSFFSLLFLVREKGTVPPNFPFSVVLVVLGLELEL